MLRLSLKHVHISLIQNGSLNFLTKTSPAPRFIYSESADVGIDTKTYLSLIVEREFLTMDHDSGLHGGYSSGYIPSVPDTKLK